MKTTWQIIVRGRVQGVGFRYQMLQAALELDICGEVWNREDGAVEALAQHESSEVLEEFLDLLRSGPGRVDDVSTFGVPGYPELTGFKIVQRR